MFRRNRGGELGSNLHEDSSIKSVTAFESIPIYFGDTFKLQNDSSKATLRESQRMVSPSVSYIEQEVLDDMTTAMSIRNRQKVDDPYNAKRLYSEKNGSGIPSVAATDTSSSDLSYSSASNVNACSNLIGVPEDPQKIYENDVSIPFHHDHPNSGVTYFRIENGTTVPYYMSELHERLNEPPLAPMEVPVSFNSQKDALGAINGSNICLRDMYNEVLHSQKDYFQKESADDDNSKQSNSKANDTDTPPTSLHTKSGPAQSPPIHPMSAPNVMPDIASMCTTEGSLSSELKTKNTSNHHPILYSAIGSLEDPTNSSYKTMQRRAAIEARQRKTKFDFPSSSASTVNGRIKNPQDGFTKHVGSRLLSKNSDRFDLGTNVASQLSTAVKANDEKIKPKTSLRQSQKATDASLVKSEGTDLISNETVNTVKKKVVIAPDDMMSKQRKARKTKKSTTTELFRPSSDAYTPRMGKKEIKYKPAAMRTPVQHMASPLGTISRPNFRDALRRVAMIIRQHIVKIEQRFESKPEVHDGLFSKAMRDAFSEECYITPRYKCSMVRVPMARPGILCGLKRVRIKYEIPSEAEIYEFAERLFKTVQLSSECSIVCLIYIERLMEAAKVPLLSTTWRPIFLCGLLLASKVWQDLSSWNIEFASVYPQYSLDSINKLELQFLKFIKWDLYISGSAYAKYYFALRSLVEKTDFRMRYNRMVGRVGTVEESEARKIEERTTMVKEEALLHLSRSM